MGYSCTKDAHDMLGLIRNQFSDGTSNGLVIRGRSYFYEVGREKDDGSIVGPVYENIDESHARQIGRFRINADGSIARFPGIKRNMRTSMYFLMLEIQRTDPHRLSSYMGVI